MTIKNMNLTPILLLGLLVLSHFNTCSCNITCEQALSILLPCVGYLLGTEQTVSAQCCQGATKLKDMAKTKPDLKTLCFCFKDAVKKFHIDLARAKAIPSTCHISVPIPIDPNVDCNKLIA